MATFPGLADYRHFGFLTLTGYSMIALSNAIEALRMANYLAGEHVYDWRIMTLDGQPATASNGLTLSPTTQAEAQPAPDLVFVCGGVDVRAATGQPLLAWLRRRARAGQALGALCTGTFALAEAGVLRGYRCAIHWENLSSIREEFSEIDITDDLFVIDRNRLTCTGGLAPLEMMLTLVAARFGRARIREISAQFLLDRPRTGTEAQPGSIAPDTPLPLSRALRLIERESERQLPITEVADAAHLSVRQLERLFRRHLGTTPAAYMIAMRLEKARRLLRQTSMSVTDISVACGFVSSTHFSSVYRSRFGHAPREERKARTTSSLPITLMDQAL